ncbi:hypothetical protein [Variovorax arabinosiphilus]|uniref:hypothetical protein n=1 Tax=Variovorax arabinosiphilus TaxID=3053498 RepID=UPI002576548B|nr:MULTISPECIES: hypothetical protein [unclassified Variovorax]MDM0118508.1 hypothetical protein [Variovorax sp. J2L1-78]MDM0128933.1 hypothetical protein [Variovorax sp. J2L1-63]MDM0233282.1 hypothetical protein [Variovorax sp. J2R1-6]
MRALPLPPVEGRSFFTGRRAVLAGVAAAALGLAGCAATRSTERAEGYDSREWMQSSANRIANLALRDNLQSIRRVQLSLYRRNPREWRKGSSNVDDAIQRTWDAVMQGTPLPPLGGKSGIDAVRLAFEPAYAGDRIAALVYGWATMLKEANGNTWEQTMVDGVNAENSFRAARNIEISLWLIGSKTGADGQPLLLATEISERGRNLVVDRELSKIVARLDLLAAQADEKYRRAALDFAQGWIMGSLGPFLSLTKP